MIKYLFKYISKGPDRVRYCIKKAEASHGSSSSMPTDSFHRSANEDSRPINEVQIFSDGRYICPHEAAWRILDFNIHHRHPSVQILTVHEENMQQLIFKGDSSIPEVLSNPVASITTLLG